MKTELHVTGDWMKRTYWVFTFVLCFIAQSNAQNQIQKNLVLESFIGKWIGTYERTGHRYSCEAEISYALHDQFVEGHILLSDSNSEKTDRPEIRLFFTSAGVGRIAVNTFDSRGISTWGILDISEHEFIYSCDHSNGLKETGVLQHSVPDAPIEYSGTIHNVQGDVVDHIVIALNRVPQSSRSKD